MMIADLFPKEQEDFMLPNKTYFDVALLEEEPKEITYSMVSMLNYNRLYRHLNEVSLEFLNSCYQELLDNRFQRFFDKLEKETEGAQREEVFHFFVAHVNFPLKQLQKGLSLLSNSFANFSYAERSVLLHESAQYHQPDKMKWLLEQLPSEVIEGENLLIRLMEVSLLYSSLDCIEYLLPLKEKWELTPMIGFVWALKDCANPLLDACIKKISPYFNPDSDSAYPASLNFSSASWQKDVSDSDSCVQFLGTGRVDCSPLQRMAYFALTPFMTHCLEEDKLNKQEAKLLVTAMIYHAQSLMKNAKPSFQPEFTIIHGILDNAPEIYQNDQRLNENFLLLLEKFPHFLTKNEEARCLLTALALTQDPHPEILALAENLTGTQLVITNYEFPWFGYYCAFGDLENQLFSRWEERMPAKLKPVIKYKDFQGDMFTVTDWLERCEVVGKPPKNKLSSLAQLLIEFPSDSPYFIEQLKPNGILSRERKLVFQRLFANKREYRSHYLMALAVLQEENKYEL